MTNIRSSGFDSPSQLREHLAEIDDAGQEVVTDGQRADDSVALREIAWLRRDVAVLREQLEATQNQSTARQQHAEHPWLRLLLAVAMTTVLGAIARRGASQ